MDKFLVKRDDWHYKLVKLWNSGSDMGVRISYSDFCSYWRTVSLLTLGLVVAAVLITLLICFLLYSPLYVFFLQPFYGLTSKSTVLFGAGTIADGILIFIASILYLWKRYDWGSKLAGFFESLFAWFYDRKRERNRRRWNRQQEREDNPPQPSLFRQWLRTTRDKVCIGVEYERE
jgi:hypothetical protein